MKTVSSLLDAEWYERYKRISKLNIRSSIYDVTNRCNLRCKGCFFFSSDEHKAAPEETDIDKWEAFIDREMERGVNLAILIGGEPTLCLDRVEAFYKRLPTFCATNGLIKVPRDRFPGYDGGHLPVGRRGGRKDPARAKTPFAYRAKLCRRSPCLLSLHHHPEADRQDRKHHPQNQRCRAQGPHAAALQRRRRGRIFLDTRSSLPDIRDGDGRDAGRLSGDRHLLEILPRNHHHRQNAGPPLRLEGMPLGHPAAGPPRPAAQTPDRISSAGPRI